MTMHHSYNINGLIKYNHIERKTGEITYGIPYKHEYQGHENNQT